MLTRDEAVDLLAWIHDQPQYRHYQLNLEAGAANSYDLFADELAGLPITFAAAKDVCRSIMAEDGAFPAPQRIYRRCLEAVGVLAPSWPQAATLIRGALTRPEGAPVDLPGPVAAAVAAKGGLWALRRTENEEASFAQLRDTYRGFAAAHDRFVLEPGGLERFGQVCEFVAAVDAELVMLANGRWAAMQLEWDTIPGDRVTAAQALADYQDEFGEPAVWGVEPSRPLVLRDRSAEVAAMTAELVRSWAPPPDPDREFREKAAAVSEARIAAAERQARG